MNLMNNINLVATLQAEMNNDNKHRSNKLHTEHPPPSYYNGINFIKNLPDLHRP